MHNSKNTTDFLADAQESSMDLEQLWFVLREKAWLIGLFGLVGIFASLAYIHHKPASYVATSVLQVDPEPAKLVDFENVGQQRDLIGDETAGTLVAVFNSRAFLEQVLRNYKFHEDPEFLPPLPSGKPHALEDGIGPLSGMAHAALRHGTRFIDVTAQHQTPRIASQVADALANTFIQREIDQKAAASEKGIQYLLKEGEKLKDKLQHSEMALQDYVEKTNSISLQEKQDTVVTELKNQSGQLGAARAARMKLEVDDEEIQKHLHDAQALLAIASIANHPTILASKQQVNNWQAQIVTLALRYTEKHPKMIQARAELADAQQRLTENVLKMPAVIHFAYESAVATETKFEDAQKVQEKLAMGLNRESINYNVLARDVETDRALYEAILKRLKEARIATGVESTMVHIFEPAQLPVSPEGPRKSRVLAIGLAGGLAFGLALSLGLHLLDSSVKTVDQAEQIFNLNVLAAVTRRPRSGLKKAGISLIKEPGSPVAEAFRSLRTALYLAGRGKDRKIVLFTSAVAGEGKTFCSVNYAAALAQQGLQTLLIDADLRAPMAGWVLLSKKEGQGLAEVLSKKTKPMDAVCATELENLSILPVGELVPNPAELLAGKVFGDVLRELAEKFDRLVIDTAPVTAVSDTLLLVEHAQLVCLVAQAGKTPRKWILRAIKLLSEAGCKPAGLVLNQVPMRMSGASGYYPGAYGDPELYGAISASPDSPKAAAAEKVS